MPVKTGFYLILQIAAQAPKGGGNIPLRCVQDRVGAGDPRFAVIGVEVPPAIGPSNVQVELTIEPFLLVGQHAQLIAGDVIVQGRTAKIAADGTLPIAPGRLADTVIEDKDGLFEMQCCAVQATERGEVNVFFIDRLVNCTWG